MTISVIIPSRAEFGPLASVIAALPGCNVVRFDSTGMSPAIAMAQALPYYTAVFTNMKTTRVLVLGDRYETLAAALAALFLGIPVAHCHGGETTEGAFDDPMRHAITHVASLHFVAHEDAAERVMLMKGFAGPGGPSYLSQGIHVVGAPGLDGIPQASAKRDRKLILVTYHPETRAEDLGLSGCRAMLTALTPYTATHDIWFCGVNNDPGGKEIEDVIYAFDAEYNTTNSTKIKFSLDHARYVEHMQSAALVIGNSSAGIIEAPWIGVPSVNIGHRQKGRPLATSVFQWNHGDEMPLDEIIVKALGFVGFSNPHYYGGPVGERIANILKGTT